MKNNRQEEHHALHSYCIKPNIRFEAQGVNEQPLLVLRAHPFTQIYWIINTFIFFILIFLIVYFFSSYLSIQQILFIIIAGTIFTFAYLWFNFLSWFFNVGIITNERIIDVDYINVIYKEISETRLNRIEDITAKSGGYFQSFFDYGDVFIQTAGTETNIEFPNIPRPSEVVKLINDLIGNNNEH